MIASIPSPEQAVWSLGPIPLRAYALAIILGILAAVWIGDRRWDVVLDRDQRIMLPEDDPVTALQRVIALDSAQDMMARDLVVVDMRNPARPTVRLGVATTEFLTSQITGVAAQ